MPTERIWELMAKKLTGESSPSELKELEDLLRTHPDLHYPLQTIADMWQQGAPGEEDAHEAFQRHIARMNQKLAGAEDDIIHFGSESQVAGRDAVIRSRDTHARHSMMLQSAPEDSLQTTGDTSKIKKGLYLLAALLCLSLLAGTYYAYRYNSFVGKAHLAPSHAFSTRPGAKKKLILPDGTRVWLNASSSISYGPNFGTALREVTLSGEAYFNVSPDEKKPFIIHTKNIAIKVLGTVFNVKSYPGEMVTETSLIQGSIEVSISDRPSDKIVIRPREKLVIATSAPKTTTRKIRTGGPSKDENIIAISHLTYAPNDSSILETSWIDNKLTFRSETFEELAVKMERWYGVNIDFADETISKTKFTGIFQTETVEQALKALQVSVPFSYEVADNHIKISK